MKVVILCGGKGTRLGLETKTIPKPNCQTIGQKKFAKQNWQKKWPNKLANKMAKIFYVT